MGKKTKKTRWRTLPIDVGATSNGHDKSSHHVREDTSKLQAPPPETTTTKVYFNEDEYTKITTPRQDVLFKKGYFARRRSQLAAVGINIISDPSSMYETPHCDYAEDEDYMNEDYDMQGYYGTSQAYVDPAGVYYNYGTSSYEVFDSYTGTTTVLMGPPPGTQYPPGASHQMPPLGCSSAPLEWYNPATLPPQHVPYYSKRFPGDPSQAYPSPESLCPPTSPQDLCDDPSIYPHSFIYPGYMLSTTNTYSNGSVGVPSMTAGSLPQTSPCDSSSFKKRKRRKKRKRGEGVTEEEYESSSEDQCSQSGASEQLDSKTTSDSGVHTHNSGESTPVTPPLSISFHPHPVPAFTSTDEDSTSSMPCFTNTQLPINSCSYLPVNPYHIMSYSDIAPPQPVMEPHYVMQHKSKKLKPKRTKADHLNKFFPSAALASIPCSFHSSVPNSKLVEPAPKQLTILKPETPRKQPSQITILKPNTLNSTQNETENIRQRVATTAKQPVRDSTPPENLVVEHKHDLTPFKDPVDEEKDSTLLKHPVVENDGSKHPKNPVVEEKVPLVNVEITTNNTNCSILNENKSGETKAEDNEARIDNSNVECRGEEADTLSSNLNQQTKIGELNKSHQRNTNQVKVSTDSSNSATEPNNVNEKIVNKKDTKENHQDENYLKNVQCVHDLEKEALGELNQSQSSSIVVNGVLDEVTNMKAKIKEFNDNDLHLTNGNLHNPKDKSLNRSPSPPVSKITNGFNQPDKAKSLENGSDKTYQKQKQKSKKNKPQNQIDSKSNGVDKNNTQSAVIKNIQNGESCTKDVEYNKAEENTNKLETAKINGLNEFSIQENGLLTNSVKNKKKSTEKVATIEQELDIITGFPREINDDNKFETCSDKSEELEELYIKNNPLLANLVQIEKINNNERDVADKNKTEILKKELLENSKKKVENEIINKRTRKIDTVETKNENRIDTPEQIKTEISDETKRLTDIKDVTNPNSIETTQITVSKKKADKKKKNKEIKNQSLTNKTGLNKIKEMSPDPIINNINKSDIEGILLNGDTKSDENMQDLTIDKTDETKLIISNNDSTKKTSAIKESKTEEKTNTPERKSPSPDKMVKRKNSKKKKSPPPQSLLPPNTEGKESTIDNAKSFIDEMLREAVNKVNKRVENDNTSINIPVNKEIVQNTKKETMKDKKEVQPVIKELLNRKTEIKPVVNDIANSKIETKHVMSEELDQECGSKHLILTKVLNAKNEINPVVDEAKSTLSSETKPLISGVKPVLSETIPVIREVKSILNEVSTTKNEVEPTISVAKSVTITSEVKPISSEVKPDTKEVKHVLNETKPIKSEAKLVTSELKSVLNEVNPVTSEVKHVKNEIKLVTRENKPDLYEVKPVKSDFKSVTSEVKPVMKSKKVTRKNSGKSLKTNSKSKSNTPERKISDPPLTAPVIHLTDVVTKWLEEEHGGKLPVDYLDDEEDEVFVQPTLGSAATGSKNLLSNPSPASFVNVGDRVADKNSDIIDRCDAKECVSKYYNLGIRTSPEVELMTPASKDPQFTYPDSPIPCGICCMIQ